MFSDDMRRWQRGKSKIPGPRKCHYTKSCCEVHTVLVLLLAHFLNFILVHFAFPAKISGICALQIKHPAFDCFTYRMGFLRTPSLIKIYNHHSDRVHG